MMSRALFLASCVAVAVSDRAAFRPQCVRNDACGGTVCCAAGWTMHGDNRCVSNADGTTCGLCGQPGMSACSVTAENCGSPYAVLLDANDAVVPVVAPAVVASMGGPPASPAPTTFASSGVTLALGTFHGMDGWHDIENSRFYNFFEFLQGLAATIPSFHTAAGFKVKYDCSSQGVANLPADFVGCDIFFFVYRCPPCEAPDGGIGEALLAMDEPTWYAQNCGPTFKLNKDGGYGGHTFAVYMAEIPDGTTTIVPLAERVEFMFWAMIGKSVICSTKLTAAECGDSPINCEWLEGPGVCRPRACPPASPFHGPGTPRCSTCLEDEASFIPLVVPAGP